jgi:chromosome segregation ATPase
MQNGNKRHWLLALIGLLILLSLKASADTTSPVQTEKDWQLQKSVDSTLGVSSCVASTAVAKSDIPVKIELIFPEQDDKAAIILIHTKNLQAQIQKAYLRPDAKTLYTAALLTSDATSGEDVFLLSSLQIPEALQIIAAKNTLDVYFGEGATAKLARISLSGSSVTLTRAANCRASKKILNDSFMNLIRQDVAHAAAVSGTSTDFLTSYEGTLALINQRSVAQQALNIELQKQSQLASQAQAAQAADTKAAQNEQAAIQTSANLKTKIGTIQSSIASSQKSLPALQARRPQAASAVDQASQSLVPIDTQVQQLQYSIDQAVDQQQARQSDVSSAQSQVASAQSQIDSLRRQISDLGNQQYSQQNSINQLQSQVNDLNYRISSFNNNSETQNILNSDSSYRQAQNDLQKWQQIQQYSPGQIADAQSRLQKAQQLLQQCQNQHPAPPVPAPDCSGQQNRLNMIESEVRQRQAQYAQANSEISSLQGQIANIERDAHHRADQVRDGMISQRDDLTRQQQNVQSQISQLQQQINQIQQYNLPQAQQQLSQRQSDVNQAQANLNVAINQVSRAEARLSQYKNSVGYDQLMARLSNARDQLQDLDGQIASAQDWIQNGPARLAKAQQDLIASDANIQTQHTARLQADQIFAQAQTLLAAQQTVVAGAQAGVDQLSSGIETSRRTTQGLSKTVF